MVGDSPERGGGARRCSVPLSACHSQPEGWARAAAGSPRAAVTPVQPRQAHGLVSSSNLPLRVTAAACDRLRRRIYRRGFRDL